MKMASYKVLGIMSGSSLDGVDLTYCEFKNDQNGWRYQLIKAETIPYSEYWIQVLASSPNFTDTKLANAHTEYGRYLGNITHNFLLKYSLNPDIIASHGHTVFHAPERGFTFQLGEGQAIADQCGHTVVCDFRSKDISLGGQGAPLVPIGDEYLFNEYDYCLNLGGIANISFKKDNKRIAFDICPANQMINYLSGQIGKPYDDQGKIARSGRVNHALLAKLNKDPFYTLNPPKSLSNQYVQDQFIRLIDVFNDSIENKLHTVTEHIVIQISNAIKDSKLGKLLITGGGAYNTFLIDKLRELIPPLEIILPDKQLIDFKEALIFGFMGVLRIRNEVNCLSSVTGSKMDCSGGVIFYP